MRQKVRSRVLSLALTELELLNKAFLVFSASSGVIGCDRHPILSRKMLRCVDKGDGISRMVLEGGSREPHTDKGCYCGECLNNQCCGS
jgi:hypothetical protein